MQENKERKDSTSSFRRSRDKEIKTADFPASSNLGKNIDGVNLKKSSWYNSSTSTSFFHYLSLFLLGLLTWGFLWIAFGDDWSLQGPWFRISAVALVAWVSGQIFHFLTTMPPLLAALLTGILARNLNILDMRDYTHIDAFIRKIYPILILGKGSLAWDVNYMRVHWRRVAALGTLPWTAEVLTLTICTNQLLGFPWIWGVLLGSIYASVSCPVIMPSVAKIGVRAGRIWPQFICTAGGVDTTLSVGVYGLVHSYIFVEVDSTYRYIKAALTLFAGAALGGTWGYVAGHVPHSGDYFVTEMRVLFVLLGGLFGNFFTAHIGWGGTGVVAVLVCNATAATYWARDGWKLNNNPASTTYRVLWAAAEPLVFAYTGTYFVINATTGRTLMYGLAILLICTVVRLSVAFLVCWDMPLKEKIYVCCIWSTKSIVEAVLGPVAINTLLVTNYSRHEMGYADDLVRLLVELILITTPIGFALTHYLGPRLLQQDQKKMEADTESVPERRLSINANRSRRPSPAPSIVKL